MGRVRRHRRVVAGLSVVAMSIAVLQVVEAPSSLAKSWSPAAQSSKPIASHVETVSKRRIAKTPSELPLPTPTWPTAGTSNAASTSAAAQSIGSIAAVRAGASPVAVGKSAVAGEPVSVTMGSHAAALAAGVDGVIFTVNRTSGSASLPVSLDYAGFADGGGADFGSLLHLVSMPACALTTPTVPACRVQTTIPSTNDPQAQTVSTTIAGTVAAMGTATSSEAVMPATGGVVLAADSAPAGSSGSFAATSLSPSGSWSQSGASGDFDWSYPITLPPAAAGSDVTPSVSLSYDSGSIDGQIPSTNNQSSWVGAGWDYTPGYIERSYETCGQDPTLYSVLGGSQATAAAYGDECWDGNVVTMNLGGSTTSLVLDDSTGVWKAQRDSGAKIELVGAGTSGYQGEYWRVTTTDGVQYYFGLDNLPGGTTDTNATLTTRVYGGHSSDPCYHSTGNTFAGSACTQAYRWNLDFVVDPHGNAAAYYYTDEAAAYYGAANGTTAKSYQRAADLTEIDYGLRDEDGSIAGTDPSDKVIFTTAERCVPSSGVTCTTPSQRLTNPTNWPDTPQGLDCSSGSTCNTHTPTYWSTKMLTNISTYALISGAYKKIDSYALAHTFSTSSEDQLCMIGEMCLQSITRTAYPSVSGSSITLDPVSFQYEQLDNHVDGYSDLGTMDASRLTNIFTETGEEISVHYNADNSDQAARAQPLCTSTYYPTNLASNTYECFPVIWTPPYNTTQLTDLFHKYVVTEVDQTDLNDIGTERITTYNYLGTSGTGTPAWHQDDNEVVQPNDRTYGQFRGYSQVETRVGNDSQAGSTTSLTITTYYRGMGGTITDPAGDSVTDSDQYADIPLETQTFDNGDSSSPNELSAVVTKLETVATTATRTRTGLPALTATIVAPSVQTTYTDLAAGGTRFDRDTYTYDSLGRQIQDSNTGTNISAECTSTSYATSPSSLWINDAVSEVIKSAQQCPAVGTAPSNVLSDVRTYYDGTSQADSPSDLGTIPSGGHGDATETDTLTTSTPTDHWAVVSTTYDTSGRIKTQIVDPNTSPDQLRTTTTTYTPADGGPLTEVQSKTDLVPATVTILDPGRGVTLSTTDPSGRVTAAAYDALGRVTSVWAPGHSEATDKATTKYAYQYDSTQPLAVTTSTLNDRGNNAAGNAIATNYIQSVAIYDAFGQPRQTQTPAEGGGTIVTDTIQDAHGWTLESNNKWYSSLAETTAGPITPDNQSEVPDSTQTTYDGAGRPLVSTEYAGATATWSTTTTYSGDSTTVIPPTGGIDTTTYTDARGNTTKLTQWKTPPSISDGVISGGTADTTTAYSYDVLNRQTSMTTAQGTSVSAVWRMSYDLAGRMSQQQDPDSGTTSTSYDDAGDVTSTQDANGTVLTYTYDQLGRKTAEYNDTGGTSVELDSWAYDSATNGVGLLASSTRYTSGGNYVQAINSYDAEGDITSTTLTIPSSQTGLAGSYTTTYGYTSTGQLQYVTDANVGDGLWNEEEQYTYDSLGNPTYLGSFNPTNGGGLGDYVSGVTYNALGAPTQYDLQPNNAATQGTLSYSYDPQTQRLTDANLSANTAYPQIADVTYRYDDAGNIVQSVDTEGDASAGAPVESLCYQYTAVDQLSAAWSSTSTSSCPDPAVDGNSVVSGAQPYWESWTYDAAGDRITQTQHALAGSTGGDTITTNTVGGTGDPAHALTTATTTGPGAGTINFTYNNNGSTHTGTIGGIADTYTYNPDNSTNTVTNSAGTTTYQYDASGDELIRADPNTTTLFLPGEDLVRTNSTGAIQATRYYSISGTTVTLTTGSGWPEFIFADPQGTEDVALPTSATGAGTAIRQYFDPFGNPIGSSGSWPTQRGFLNKPSDIETGLTDVGAREYDPQSGTFISVDPLLDAGNPQSTNGYAYSANNPISNSDPSGEELENMAGGGCATQSGVCASAKPTGGGTTGATSAGGNSAATTSAGGNGDPSNSGSNANQLQQVQQIIRQLAIANYMGQNSLNLNNGITDCKTVDCVYQNLLSQGDLQGAEQAAAAENRQIGAALGKCGFGCTIGGDIEHHWRGLLETATFAGCTVLSAGYCAFALTVSAGVSDFAGHGPGLKQFIPDAGSALFGFGASKAFEFVPQLLGTSENQIGITVIVRSAGAHAASTIDGPATGFNMWFNAYLGLTSDTVYNKVTKEQPAGG